MSEVTPRPARARFTTIDQPFLGVLAMLHLAQSGTETFTNKPLVA
jgi:hypothetical protein